MNVPTSVFSIRFSSRWYHTWLSVIILILCSTLFDLNSTIYMNPLSGLIYLINGQYFKYHELFTQYSIYFCAIHFTCCYLFNKSFSCCFYPCQYLPHTILTIILLSLVLRRWMVFHWNIWFYSINPHIYVWSWLVWWIILNWFEFW